MCVCVREREREREREKERERESITLNGEFSYPKLDLEYRIIFLSRVM